MPSVLCKEKDLFAALGRTYTREEFDDLCFRFGIELDSVTNDREIAANELKNKIEKKEEKEKRKGKAKAAGKKPPEDEESKLDIDLESLSTESKYKIEVPANRYDLLCLEGIASALRVFLEQERPPQYHRAPPKLRMIVKHKASDRIRPYVVCAVLRDITLTQSSFDSFIDLQEKLHANICRKRTLVAIGTHDLDSIKAPFTYEVNPPETIKFQALKQKEVMTAPQLFTWYKDPGPSHANSLKQYLPIIENSPVYPVIYDAERRVLSLPPIINGEHSKVTINTKNVFIECTATDYTKANVVLNTIIAMFSRYCKQPFSCEAVEVFYEHSGKKETLPNMEDVIFEADVNAINRGIGLQLSGTEMASILERMQLPAEVIKDASRLRVRAPITRSDVLHACDIMEDVAIAFGYNNIPRTLPKTSTIGRQLPLNKLSDQLREAVAQAGFLEVMTWALISHKENYDFLHKKDDGRTAVALANPVSQEFDVVRSSLLPGLLKTLGASVGNAHLPVKIFELSDVSYLDPSKDVGARNNRRVAALYCSTTSGFEVIHGLVDRIMTLLDIPFKFDDNKDDTQNRRKSNLVYYIEPSNDETFFPGRRADVYLSDQAGGTSRKIGAFGVLHPEVLSPVAPDAYKIPYPACAIELDIEVFLH